MLPTAVNDIRAATPVQGFSQWYPMAQAQLWLLGHGANLVSLGPFMDMTTANGFACHAYPHTHILNWLWILSLARTGLAVNVWGHFTGAQGTDLGTWQLDNSLPPFTPQTFMFVETFTSMPASYSFFPAVYVDSASLSVCQVSLSATELPAGEITTFGSAGEEAVDPATCANNAPIYEPSSATQHRSASGLAELLYSITAGAGLIGEARRATLYNWAHPIGVSTTSSSFASMSMSEPTPTIVGRHMYNGVTTTTVRVRVRAAVVGAPNTGEVKITTSTGGTVTLSITSSTLTWYSGDLIVETEDLSRNAIDGGLRGGSREMLTIQGRVTGGSATLIVTGLHVGESETY
jgi:hypothetical protein